MKKANRRSESLFSAILLLIFWFFPSTGADQTTVSGLHRSHSMDELKQTKQILNFGERKPGEYERANDRKHAANTELNKGNYKSAYKLCKKAICGGDNSEYTKIFSDFVDISIEAYCASGILDDFSDYDYKKDTKFGYHEILSHAADIYGCCEISYNLTHIADQETDKEKAIKLRKEALFWFRFAYFLLECDGHDEDQGQNLMIKQAEILKELQG